MAKGFDKQGREILDDTPVELPVGFRHPPSLAEEIRRLVQVNLSQAAAEAGSETLDEASDFEVPDEEELVVSGLQLQTMEDERIMALDADLASEVVQQNAERIRHGKQESAGEGRAGADRSGPGALRSESGAAVQSSERGNGGGDVEARGSASSGDKDQDRRR